MPNLCFQAAMIIWALPLKVKIRFKLKIPLSTPLSHFQLTRLFRQSESNNASLHPWICVTGTIAGRGSGYALTCFNFLSLDVIVRNAINLISPEITLVFLIWMINCSKNISLLSCNCNKTFFCLDLNFLCHWIQPKYRNLNYIRIQSEFFQLFYIIQVQWKAESKQTASVKTSLEFHELFIKCVLSWYTLCIYPWKEPLIFVVSFEVGEQQLYDWQRAVEGSSASPPSEEVQDSSEKQQIRYASLP